MSSTPRSIDELLSEGASPKRAPTIEQQLSNECNRRRDGMTIEEQLTSDSERQLSNQSNSSGVGSARPQQAAMPVVPPLAVRSVEPSLVARCIDVTPCVCLRPNGDTAHVQPEGRRKPPRSIHLSVAQHVPREQIERESPTAPFDGSALRDIVVAARAGSREQVQALIQTLKAVIANNANSHLAAMAQHALNNALCAACAAAHFRIVRELLEAGAEPAVLSSDGLSPLEHAVVMRSTQCVNALLQHGRSNASTAAKAKRRFRGWRGSSALARAVELGIEPIVGVLLDAGVVVTRQVVVAAAPPPAPGRVSDGFDWIPMLIQAHCTSPEVEVRGLRVEYSLETLCRRDTAHNRAVHQRVRRQMLTHILQMSTAELVEMQVRSLRANPFDGFGDTVYLSKAFINESNAAVKANDRLSSDELGQMAMRVQVVCAGCLHLLALTDPATLLSFLHSRRAQILLCEAAEKSSPSDQLDGSCTVLLSSREIQHIYQQRWRGSTGLFPRVGWKKRMLGRLLMLPYCLAATIYPPLDVTQHVSPALYRMFIPSPRLKFAVHAIVDFSFAILLVVAHVWCGSIRRMLSDGREYIPSGMSNAFIVYLLLACWVFSVISGEVSHCWRAALREYEVLLDEMSNPSVYHAKLKHRMDETKLAQLTKSQLAQDQAECVAVEAKLRSPQPQQRSLGPERSDPKRDATRKSSCLRSALCSKLSKLTLSRPSDSKANLKSSPSSLQGSTEPGGMSRAASGLAKSSCSSDGGVKQLTRSLGSDESIQSTSTQGDECGEGSDQRTGRMRPKAKRRERRKSLWEINIAQKNMGQGAGGPGGTKPEVKVPSGRDARPSIVGIKQSSTGSAFNRSNMEDSTIDPIREGLQAQAARLGGRSPRLSVEEQWSRLRELLEPVKNRMYEMCLEANRLANRLADRIGDSEAQYVPVLCVMSILALILVVIAIGIFNDQLITTIGALLAFFLLVNLMQSSRHIAGRQHGLVQVGLLITRLSIDEPWRLIAICGRLFTLSGLVLRAVVAMIPAEDARNSAIPTANAIDEMYALGVLMAVTNQIALLHMIPGQSPFLILIQRFIVTLLNILVIALFMIFAFLLAFLALYYHQDMDASSSCGWNSDLASNNWTSVLISLLRQLFQFAVNGEGDFSCAEAHTEVTGMATFMLVLYLVMFIILVNALIAAMTKHFDEVWETQHVLVRCSRVIRLYRAEALKPLPPPFTMFALPYRIYSKIKRVCNRPAVLRQRSGSVIDGVRRGSDCMPASAARGPRRSYNFDGAAVALNRATSADQPNGGGEQGFGRLRRRSSCEDPEARQLSRCRSQGDVYASDFRTGLGKTPPLKEMKEAGKRRIHNRRAGGQYWGLEEDTAKRCAALDDSNSVGPTRGAHPWPHAAVSIRVCAQRAVGGMEEFGVRGGVHGACTQLCVCPRGRGTRGGSVADTLRSQGARGRCVYHREPIGVARLESCAARVAGAPDQAAGHAQPGSERTARAARTATHRRRSGRRPTRPPHLSRRRRFRKSTRLDCIAASGA